MAIDECLRIERAKHGDAQAVYALYHALIDAPYSTWSEDYPTRELVESDVRNGKTLVMRDGAGQIVAAVALLDPEDEPEFAGMAPWDPTVKRWKIPSRLGVDRAHQGKGLAGRMLLAAMEAAREEGCDGVQFIVAQRNPIAQRAYAKIGFDICGTHTCWGERWLCYQKHLA